MTEEERDRKLKELAQLTPEEQRRRIDALRAKKELLPVELEESRDLLELSS